MMSRPTPDFMPSTLNDEVAERLLQLQEERRRVRMRRIRSLFLWAILLSLLFHIGLMIYLHLLHRAGREAPMQEFQVEIAAMLPDEELTELPEGEMEEPEDSALSSLDELLNERQASELEADTTAAELEISGVGAAPAIGGAAGGGGTQGIGGSGAAGSFFGISSSGERFAYIVDMSGSMTGGRMDRAKQEMKRSIRALPDYTKFLVVFYNSDIVEPPDQEGWQTARSTVVRRFIRWLEDLSPKGGTEPLPAFRRVFSEEERPDVIFFLTDGEITSMTPDSIERLNTGGFKTVINTIAFGDDSSQDLLKRIAKDSGGIYRFVRSGGPP